MATSRTLVVPALRALPHSGWRAGTASALSVVAGAPSLWLLGAAGFLLRGGIALLILPIIVLPTQVEVRLALGAMLGSTGLTAEFWQLLAMGGVVALVVALAAMLGLARLELAAFERLASDPESAEQRSWREPAAPTARQRHALVTRLFAIQLAVLLAVIVCAAPVVTAAAQASLEELTRPTSGAVIYIRVVGAMSQVLFAFAIALVVIEMVSAAASRRILVGMYGLGTRPADSRLWLARALASGIVRPFRLPARTLATVVTGWLVALAALLPASWAVGVAWQTVRATYLSTTSLADPQQLAALFVPAVLLALVFTAALVIVGFASAMRAAMWSVEGLR